MMNRKDAKKTTKDEQVNKVSSAQSITQDCSQSGAQCTESNLYFHAEYNNSCLLFKQMYQHMGWIKRNQIHESNTLVALYSKYEKQELQSTVTAVLAFPCRAFAYDGQQHPFSPVVRTAEANNWSYCNAHWRCLAFDYQLPSGWRNAGRTELMAFSAHQHSRVQSNWKLTIAYSQHSGWNSIYAWIHRKHFVQVLLFSYAHIRYA